MQLFSKFFVGFNTSDYSVRHLHLKCGAVLHVACQDVANDCLVVLWPSLGAPCSSKWLHAKYDNVHLNAMYIKASVPWCVPSVSGHLAMVAVLGS